MRPRSSGTACPSVYSRQFVDVGVAVAVGVSRHVVAQYGVAAVGDNVFRQAFLVVYDWFLAVHAFGGRLFASALARRAAVACGKRERTLRQVLEYSPQSTIRDSARRLSVPRREADGNEDRVPPRGRTSAGLFWTVMTPSPRLFPAAAAWESCFLSIFAA